MRCMSCPLSVAFIIHLLKIKYHRVAAKTNVVEKNFGKCILESAAKREERGKSLFGIFDPKNLFDPKLRWRTRVAVGSLSDGRPPCSEICFFNF